MRCEAKSSSCTYCASRDFNEADYLYRQAKFALNLNLLNVVAYEINCALLLNVLLCQNHQLTKISIPVGTRDTDKSEYSSPNLSNFELFLYLSKTNTNIYIIRNTFYKRI